jgi:hypothetical protein
LLLLLSEIFGSPRLGWLWLPLLLLLLSECFGSPRLAQLLLLLLLSELFRGASSG